MNPDKVLIDAFIKDNSQKSNSGSVKLKDNPLAENLNVYLNQATSGEVELSFSVGSGFTQGGGVIQGGVIAVMLDFGLAFSALSVVGEMQSVATANITVNYYKAALTGDYKVRGRVEKKGRKLIYSSAELVNSNDDIVAIANSPLMIINV